MKEKKSQDDYQRDYEGLSIRDPENPRSLVNLCPPIMSRLISEVPDEVLAMTEGELRKHARFSDYEELVRISFWEEYRRATRTETLMNISNVYGGICSENRFYICCENKFKLAFILNPPKEVQVALESLLYIALEEMERILKLPLVDDRGRTDTRLSMVKYKIFEDIMNRRRGVLVQKTEVVSKNLNVNVETNTNEKPKRETLEDIEAEIRALEQKTLALTQPKTIDLFSTPAEKEVIEVNEKEV